MTWRIGLCGALMLLGPADALVATRRQAEPVVVLQTSLGDIHVRLWPARAPATVENFLGLVRAGFYDELLFHRVVAGVVIQAGLMDFEGRVRPAAVEPVPNEASARLSNARGTIAMAREADPHSATTEFFINVERNAHLDHTDRSRRGYGYAVFGRVVEGMDVVDAIARLEIRELGPLKHFPVEPVGIYRAYVFVDGPGGGQEH